MQYQGKIYKGIGGFYYVHTEEGDFECRGSGIFRKHGEKPLVGDNVILEETKAPEKERVGALVKILPRKNRLLRPEVANVDQAVLIFALTRPEPSLPLLDRFLINMEAEGIPTRILFNKQDLLAGTEEGRERMTELRRIYEDAGYAVLLMDTRSERYREELLSRLRGKTSVLSGPSGVGKSTLTNFLYPHASMETGELSEKIQRGKNTTRHSELFCLEGETYLLDTPGFTSLYVNEVEPERLAYYFPEFERVRKNCRYHTCMHYGEATADCAVKQAVLAGEIPRVRYQSYRRLYLELKEARRFS